MGFVFRDLLFFLKYGRDNTTALGLVDTLTIPDGKIEHLMAKYQRFCGWCEEFTITVYWHVCFMSVLGDHNSTFDTLVRMTSALELRIPGMAEDTETVDALPITLMSQVETELDASSLICVSEASDCGGCCSAATCDSSDIVIKESNSFHSTGNASDSDKLADEMDDAPILSAGLIIIPTKQNTNITF